VHGVSMGFTVGRLPSGMRVSTVAGGSSVQALHCHGGSECVPALDFPPLE